MSTSSLTASHATLVDTGVKSTDMNGLERLSFDVKEPNNATLIGANGEPSTAATFDVAGGPTTLAPTKTIDPAPIKPDPWEVRFDEGEKANPKNWSNSYRWYLTAVAGLTVLNATFASSAPSGIMEGMTESFDMSQIEATLTVSLFVGGFCVGPVIWGPLSELHGRRWIYLSSFLAFIGCQVGCALSRNTASILVFRFLGGCFSAAPLTNSGGMIADIWDTDHRGQAMSIFALAPFAGPSIGPIVAGFIQSSGVNWRWVYWILAIFSGVCLLILTFTVPETYAPKLLKVKAQRVRKSSGDERWYAPLERVDRSWKARINNTIMKPFIMLALEPSLLAITIYMSFLYGLVYLLLGAFPFVFMKIYGFNYGEEGLAFLGFFLGGCCAVLIFMTIIEPRFQKHSARMHPLPPTPEKRLELAVYAAWILVGSMFWFAWTSNRSIHWISPLMAGGGIGLGVLGVNIPLFNYIVDSYVWAAASALAGPTVVRSFFGAGFPLFTVQMYDRLGTRWATSLLGFLTLVMAPIPLALVMYGSKLRARSKFSPLTNHTS